VLVPVVYLAAQDQKTIQNGALIAGTNVVMKVAGNINNSGSIQASGLVSLTGGNDIVNALGGKIAGGTVIASAARDILNGAGSSISGGDILLNAGRDIVLSSATDTSTSASRTDASKGRFTSTSTSATTITGSAVTASGNLVMNAGRDISINSSTVTAGGSAALLAGRDVTITGANETSTTTDAYNRGKKDFGTSTTTTQTFVGSTVAAGGNLTIGADNKVAVTGSQLAAGNNVFIQGAGGVTIESGVSNGSSSSASKLGRNTASSSTTSLTNTLSGVTAGGDLTITTPQALTIAGANLSAGGTANLIGGTVTITGVVDEATSDSKTVTVKKGFLSKKTTTVTTSITDETVIGSTVQAGEINITSVGDLKIAGSNLASVGNTSLTAGGLIDVVSMVENDSSSQTTSIKKSGFSLGGFLLGVVTGGVVVGAANSVQKNTSTKVETNTTSTNILSSIQAGGDLNLAASGLVAIKGATLDAAGTTSIIGNGVTISGVIDSSTSSLDFTGKKSSLLTSARTTQTSKASDQFVVQSTVSGGAVDIKSAGDISILGSNVAGTGNVSLAAVGKIDVGTLAATSTLDESQSFKKSGISFQGIGIFAGVAKNSASSTVNAVTNTGSLVGSAEGDVTLNAGKALTITGSTVASPGVTSLIGERVTIQNALDVTNTTNQSKSSSVGLSVSLNIPLVNTLNNIKTNVESVANLGQVAANSSNSRTQAVAGVAGALAVKNTIDSVNALPSITSAIKDPLGTLTKDISVSVSFGASSSRSNAASTDQTVLGSAISGGDVNIIARTGGIDIKGSSVTAGRDLAVIAPGAINITSAVETDTATSSNRSSGFSVGVAIGSKGITPTASLDIGRGKSSGTDVTHVESVLAAGNLATIATPGALTLQGGILTAEQVKINAGSLAITSEQDTSTFKSSQLNIGVNFGGQTFSQNAAGKTTATGTNNIGANFSSSRQNEQFASVIEQSGIKAGNGGFDINIAGATDLKAGVIASTADAALNRLTTGTLTTSNLVNTEVYKASSLSLGGGLNLVGRTDQGVVKADGTKGDPGKPLPGFGIPGVGTLSGTLPIALGASGNQTSTTLAAIAPANVTITTGDQASLDAVATISRDTATANPALVQKFDAAGRAEVEEGFTVARELATQTATFFANRAAEEKQFNDEAARRAKALADGYQLDERGNRVPLTAAERALYSADKTVEGSIANLEDKASELNRNFRSTSPARILATALTAAAGSNVAGSLGNLAQTAAVNVLQSLAVEQIKGIADSFGVRNADGTLRTNPDGSVIQTTASETARAVLQGLAGCAGAAAGGSGSCTGAAIGASTSVLPPETGQKPMTRMAIVLTRYRLTANRRGPILLQHLLPSLRKRQARMSTVP
jgi:filamentous hemagglutinin